MADLGASRYFGDLEDRNDMACWECAVRNGHTKEEADDCDNGSVDCPDCPFRPAEVKKGDYGRI